MTSTEVAAPRLSKSVNKAAKQSLFVVKIKCLPFGFFEKQLWEYFTQFGTVVRARVARSKKTGNHKGWAYVGFDHRDVAEIAAETMNGYLMFEKKLLCHVMDEIPKCMKAGPRYVDPPTNKAQSKKDAVKRNANRDEEQEVKAKKRRAAALAKAAEKLKTMGIDYDLGAERPAYSAVVGEKPASTEEDDDVVEEVEEDESDSSESEAESVVEEVVPSPVPKKSPKKTKSVEKVMVPSPVPKKTPKKAKLVEKVIVPSPVAKKTPQKVVSVEEVEVPVSLPKKTPKKAVVAKTPPTRRETRSMKTPAAAKPASASPVKTAKKTPARAPAVKAVEEAARSTPSRGAKRTPARK